MSYCKRVVGGIPTYSKFPVSKDSSSPTEHEGTADGPCLVLLGSYRILLRSVTLFLFSHQNQGMSQSVSGAGRMECRLGRRDGGQV